MAKEFDVKDLGIPWHDWCLGFDRYFGLMLRKNPGPLIIYMRKPKNVPINSMFVRVDFLAIWLDENDKLIDAKIIKPGEKEIRVTKPFKSLIELPIHNNKE